MMQLSPKVVFLVVSNAVFACVAAANIHWSVVMAGERAPKEEAVTNAVTMMLGLPYS